MFIIFQCQHNFLGWNLDPMKEISEEYALKTHRKKKKQPTILEGKSGYT